MSVTVLQKILKKQHLFTALLVLALVFSVAMLVKKYLTPLGVRLEDPAAAPSGNTARNARPLKAYLDIASGTVLGSPRQPKKMSANEAARLPKAKVNANLVGTVHSDDQARAGAILQIKNIQRMYRVGDKVGNGVIIKINRRSVVFERNGREEVMEMPEK